MKKWEQEKMDNFTVLMSQGNTTASTNNNNIDSN